MKPPRIWLITDTHFNHEAMVQYCGRPTNHTELILKNWREAVRDCDLTIHLGDVIIGRDSEMEEMIRSVSGKKVLVLGNHDQKKPRWYMERGFDFACDSFRLGEVFFSHMPTLNMPDGCTVNIHGHFHNMNHHDHEFPKTAHCRLLAIEYTDYKPVLLDDFISILAPSPTL